MCGNRKKQISNESLSDKLEHTNYWASYVRVEITSNGIPMHQADVKCHTTWHNKF